MRRIAGCILGIAIVGVLACSDGPAIADPCEDAGCSHFHVDGAALFEQVCSDCHSLELPLAASISLHDEVWVLMREMRDEMTKQGKKIPAEYEQAAIVEYICDLKACIDGE